MPKREEAEIVNAKKLTIQRKIIEKIGIMLIVGVYTVVNGEERLHRKEVYRKFS